jgi:hypothetical protein
MEGLVKINEEFVMILKINKAFSSDEADELNLLLDSKQRKANNNN